MFKSKNIGYIVFSLFLFGSYSANAQANLNKYKYIVVPKKFEDFKKENQHQLNTLVKHLFSKKGFTTVWEDGMPQDLANNQCQALFVSLKEKSSMFSTKTTIVLNDCNKQEVFSSIEGRSKEKDYKKGYVEAVTAAMNSFDGLNYEYEGDEKAAEPITVSFKNDVKELKEPESSSVVAKKQSERVLIQEATFEKQTYEDKTPVQSDFKKVEKAAPIVEQIATTEEQVYQTSEPVESGIKKTETKKDVVTINSEKQNTSVLYAQEIGNGFQLVDSTPKILLKILKTSISDYYLAEGEGGNGMVYTKDGKWYFEHYKGENLVTEELNIKF